MRTLRGLRVVSSHRRGSSRPIVVETAEGPFLTKLRGAAQGTAPLVAEIVVAHLADALGLNVPRRALVSLDEELRCEDGDSELQRLLAASHGVNLGFRFLEDAREIRRDEVERAFDSLACSVLWLDALAMNRDRTPKNPNILVSGRRAWLVDHGAALPFHFAWRRVTEDSPRDARYPLAAHVFGSRAPRLREWDERLAGRLSRDVLAAAIAAVPASFLEPLLPRGVSLERRRRAYPAFLWKRLKPPRPFLP
jgi:hypothetical protein